MSDKATTLHLLKERHPANQNIMRLEDKSRIPAFACLAASTLTVIAGCWQDGWDLCHAADNTRSITVRCGTTFSGAVVTLNYMNCGIIEGNGYRPVTTTAASGIDDYSFTWFYRCMWTRTLRASCCGGVVSTTLPNGSSGFHYADWTSGTHQCAGRHGS